METSKNSRFKLQQERLLPKAGNGYSCCSDGSCRLRRQVVEVGVVEGIKEMKVKCLETFFDATEGTGVY